VAGFEVSKGIEAGGDAGNYGGADPVVSLAFSASVAVVVGFITVVGFNLSVAAAVGFITAAGFNFSVSDAGVTAGGFVADDANNLCMSGLSTVAKLPSSTSSNEGLYSVYFKSNS